MQRFAHGTILIERPYDDFFITPNHAMLVANPAEALIFNESDVAAFRKCQALFLKTWRETLKTLDNVA